MDLTSGSSSVEVMYASGHCYVGRQLWPRSSFAALGFFFFQKSTYILLFQQPSYPLMA